MLDPTPLDPIIEACEILEKIIHEELPFRLIYIPQKQVVDHAAILKIVRKNVIMTVETDMPWEHQEGHIRWLIRKSVAYAILSHRWGPEGELTFEDFSGTTSAYRRLSAENSAALEKFTQICEKAQDFGCQFAWADTCCIDKKNSGEVGASIRDMYRWYRSAKVCIVHLRDTYTIDDFANDGWFKRGWTLQELLAPTCIKFYTADWKPLRGELTTRDIDRRILPPAPATAAVGGERYDAPQPQSHANPFLALVSQITGIPEYHLTHFDAGPDMIHEKMVWAAQRKTDRVEDRAYSLIGLFAVDMQAVYGEGDRAFYRLQRAIMENSPSADVFLWRGSNYKMHTGFAQSPACYVPIDFRCPLTATLTEHLQKIGRFTSASQVRDIVQKLCPRGGRPLAAMTNAGLRMEIVEYNLEPVMSEDGTTVEVEAVTQIPDELAARKGEKRWRLQVETLGSFEVTSPTHRTLGNKDFYRKVKLGVIDYESVDAFGGPAEHFRTWFEPWSLWHDLFPEDKDQFARDIIKGRKERWYIATLMYQAVTGPDRPYERIPTMDIIKVRRPPGGWKKPEIIYFR